MRLGRKNLWYSMILAGVMLLFLVGYFTLMLPSLYVDYVMEQNLQSVCRQHRAYVKNGSYEGVRVRNSTACMSLEIPKEGNTLRITGKTYSAEITLQDIRLRQVLCSFRRSFLESEGETDRNFDGMLAELEGLSDVWQEMFSGNKPASLKWLYLKDMDGEFFNESTKIHTYSDGFIVLESSIEDSVNRYVNYIAAESDAERVILSFLPVVAPEMDEIRPVVLQSLPMLGAVILLAVLLFSRAYSSGIVTPIVKLVRHTQEMKVSGEWRALGEDNGREERPDGGSPAGVKSGSGPGTQGPRDEVEELADTLEELYGQIRENYRNLEEKNRELAEENQSREVFLRASAHQLKTPVAAALLLVEGMINEVGRYRETKVYLPKVKEQLLSMRKMTEDILYLNQCARSMTLRRTDVGRVLRERLEACQVAAADKELRMEYEGEEGILAETDEAMLVQILDNLLSNAVKYTPEGGLVRIRLDRRPEGSYVSIENYGAEIPEEIESHIFEPFVRGSHNGDKSVSGSHGLGLYIASYYAKKLGFSLRVANGEDRVVSILLL